MENNKKLTRASAGNRMVAGVCAGIADQRKNLRDFHFMHII